MAIKELLKKLVIWRLLLLLVAIIAAVFIPLNSSYSAQTEVFSLQNIASMWSNFDGLHYLSLAEYGYSHPFTHMLFAFFPVYSWLIGALAISKAYLASGLLISHLSLFFAIYFLYKLIKIDFSEKIAKTTIFLTLIFPASFFFGSVNTESFFFLISVLVFYFARKKQFLLAVLFACLASATRLVGIFLWPALLIEFWLANKKNIKNTLLNPKFILMTIPPLGLISYMKYQFVKTGDYLFFITSQPGFGASRAIDKLILLHQVFFRYFKMIFTVDFLTATYFAVALEFLCGALFLYLIILSFKKTRLSYAFYALLSYLAPTFTGTFSSMPRYVNVIFPAFIVLAIWFAKRKKKTQKIYSFISILLLIISTILYTRGFFVA